MTPDDALAALLNFKMFLRPGGFARIAVPDAFYPNDAYQGWCAPGRYGQWLMKAFVYGPDYPEHKSPLELSRTH
jgi:predicted SAM-dependent methyltransferase